MHSRKPGSFDIGAVKDWLTVLAILAGGIWAVLTLWQQHTREDVIYRGRAVMATADCTMEIVGETEAFYVLKTKIDLDSASKVRFFVAESPYSVEGIKLRPIDNAMGLPKLYEEANRNFGKADVFVVQPRAGESEGIELEVGRLLESSVYLEPGSKYQLTHLTTVSKKNVATFDAISFTSTFVLAENPAKLGTRVRLDGEKGMNVEVIAYEKPKRDFFAMEDPSLKGTAIPIKDILNPKYTGLLADSNVSVSQMGCILAGRPGAAPPPASTGTRAVK